jgi:3-oxoacyl-[acyl-carrier-protein] synthase II
MIAGGTESAITPVSVAGFCRARALSTDFNDNPSVASRPFDRDRDGFVISEGCGILVLEELSHAVARGARIYGEVLSYATTSDAYHITSPPDVGGGSMLAMKQAVGFAGLQPSDIDYVNAHATSTDIGDAVEARNIETLFRSCLNRLSVSSIKGATGHMLGASGAIEALTSMKVLTDGIVPPTINLVHPDPDLGIDLVAQHARKKDVTFVLSNSFGFGGTNVSLLFSKCER